MQRYRVAEYRRSLASSERDGLGRPRQRDRQIDVDHADFPNEVGEGDFLNGGDGFGVGGGYPHKTRFKLH